MKKNSIWQKIYNISSQKLYSNNKNIAHIRPTVITSPNPLPSNFLFDLSVRAIKLAWETKIDLTENLINYSEYTNIYPGEHYRVLKSISSLLNPNVVVEIGTSSGIGTLSFLQGSSSSTEIYTYDVIPWNKFINTHLKTEDFENGRVIQVLDDLSDEDKFNINFNILDSSDIIFLDAPKDGLFEYKIMELLCGLAPKNNKLLIIDDIKFINMIELWQSIKSPKLDITSFAHGSGTGLVDLSQGLILNK